MSDVMRPIPYPQLLDWVLTEYRNEGSIFGVSKIIRHTDGCALSLFGEKTEAPFGPAAGPNTQLAQNIVAAYAAGARFFELKTVQKMDGRELAACVPKPCIAAGDEGYNCEWSTELTVEQAYEEYVKAWFLCKVLAKELGLGDPDGFIFNMSAGYDLDGIRTPKIDAFIEGMKDASARPVFAECREATRKAVQEGRLERVDESFADCISPHISRSITESTLHGCPPAEIERIATYLLEEKGLHTFIKCNPTLLGYDFARTTLDRLGFDYVAFDDHHFREDLQWGDAVPMLQRLTELGRKLQLTFGVKLTNTFPVDVKAGELPSQEMYMSGRSLFPLTIELARRISEAFGGQMRISFSGGADAGNLAALTGAGIWPVTMATNLLKPGGYQRLSQMASLTQKLTAEQNGSAVFGGVDTAAVAALAEDALTNPRYRKPVKGTPDRKSEEPLPLMDCFIAPCRTGCPIRQDIPAYLHALEEGRNEDALKIILSRNPLPFTTGTICPHTCTDRCMRSHYEEGVHIRRMKLFAAETAFQTVKPSIRPKPARTGRRIAVVGGGPAGLAAASFLAREGFPVTVFEKREQAGGVPRWAIPAFRISSGAIDRDVELALSFGAEIRTGREVSSVAELKAEGFTDVIVSCGAWAPGRKVLPDGADLDALTFLVKAKEDPAGLQTGEDVVVVGGGNTAMDVARAAAHLPGVKHVRLVYRRTKRYMPADEEELQAAVADGVEFHELLSPVSLADGVLTLDVMKLGDPDASGRRAPVSSGVTVRMAASCVISAVGERVDASLLRDAGAELDARGLPVTDAWNRTTVPHLYAAGDGRRGPATVVKAIADAQRAAAAICAEADGVTEEEADRNLFGAFEEDNASLPAEEAKARKGRIEPDTTVLPDRRCLGCAGVCEVCTDVCPNRANIAVRVPGLSEEQILHIDGMCNECGNCAVFCPHTGRPYRDKLTLYWTEEDFLNSENTGFLPLGGTRVRIRLNGTVRDLDAGDPHCGLDEPLRKLIVTVLTDKPYLLRK